MASGILRKIFGPKYKTARESMSGDTREAMTQYYNSKKYFEDFFARGAESVEFVGGNQWSAEDLGQYQSERRPTVTINITHAIVRHITGMRVNERLQPKVVPEREGTIEKADIYTKLIYFILKRNHYQAINYRVQNDQVVTGKGYWAIDIDYEDRPDGHLEIMHVPWNMVVPDHMSEDRFMRDGRYVFVSKLMTRDMIECVLKEEPHNLVHDEWSFVKWTDENDLRDKNVHDDFIDSAGQYLVLEKRELRPTKKYKVTDGKNYTDVDRELDDAEVAEYGPDAMQTFSSSRELWECLYIPALFGDRPVRERRAKLQTGTFNLVPCECYRAGHKVMGAVDDLKGEQKRMNKSLAQIVEILGYSSKGFWMIPRKAGISMEQWRQNTTRPGGAVFHDGDSSSQPQHINPASIPPGYDKIYATSLPNMQNISGVTPARMGQHEFAGESGIRGAQKLQQSRENLAVIDKNFLDGFSFLCKLIMRGIPQVYDSEFVFQALEGDDQVKDITVNQRTIDGIVNDVVNDPGEYDTNVQQSEETSSIRQADNLELATMMSQVGPQFAAFFAAEWIRGSDMPDKEDKAKKLELLSGQLMQMEAAKLQMQAMQARQKGGQAQGRNKQAEGKMKLEEQQMKLEAQKLGLDAKMAVREADRKDSQTDMQNLEAAVRIKGEARPGPAA